MCVSWCSYCCCWYIVVDYYCRRVQPRSRINRSSLTYLLTYCNVFSDVIAEWRHRKWIWSRRKYVGRHVMTDAMATWRHGQPPAPDNYGDYCSDPPRAPRTRAFDINALDLCLMFGILCHLKTIFFPNYLTYASVWQIGLGHLYDMLPPLTISK